LNLSDVANAQWKRLQPWELEKMAYLQVAVKIGQRIADEQDTKKALKLFGEIFGGTQHLDWYILAGENTEEHIRATKEVLTEILTQFSEDGFEGLTIQPAEIQQLSLEQLRNQFLKLIEKPEGLKQFGEKLSKTANTLRFIFSNKTFGWIYQGIDLDVTSVTPTMIPHPSFDWPAYQSFRIQALTIGNRILKRFLSDQAYQSWRDKIAPFWETMVFQWGGMVAVPMLLLLFFDLSPLMAMVLGLGLSTVGFGMAFLFAELLYHLYNLIEAVIMREPYSRQKLATELVRDFQGFLTHIKEGFEFSLALALPSALTMTGMVVVVISSSSPLYMTAGLVLLVIVLIWSLFKADNIAQQHAEWNQGMITLHALPGVAPQLEAIQTAADQGNLTADTDQLSDAYDMHPFSKILYQRKNELLGKYFKLKDVRFRPAQGQQFSIQYDQSGMVIQVPTKYQSLLLDVKQKERAERAFNLALDDYQRAMQESFEMNIKHYLQVPFFDKLPMQHLIPIYMQWQSASTKYQQNKLMNLMVGELLKSMSAQLKSNVIEQDQLDQAMLNLSELFEQSPLAANHGVLGILSNGKEIYSPIGLSRSNLLLLKTLWEKTSREIEFKNSILRRLPHLRLKQLIENAV